LSPLGERQAAALGRVLASRALAAVYTSPSRRAARTAELALESVKQVVPRQELAEIDHGEWSGLTRGQVAQRWPELFDRWQANPGGVTMPGGESLADVRRRALTFLAGIRQEHAEGDILVITHGTVLRLLLAHFLDMQPDQLWSIEAESCGLSVVDDYEPPLIMAINDTCHLEGVRSSLSAQVR